MCVGASWGLLLNVGLGWSFTADMGAGGPDLPPYAVQQVIAPTEPGPQTTCI